LAGAACDGAPVARFTLAEGTGGEPLRVVTAEQHYRADWKEKERPAGAVYRVRVLLDGAELGRGDLRVLRPGETEAAVIAAGYVPVSQSQTVLVRFRLETSADYLPGAPGAPAAAAIPRVSFAARPGDYSTGHPTLPKSRLSHNTVHVVPALGTTTAQLNALLAELDATVVGGVPGVNGVAGGVLTLRLPTTTHAALAAVLTRLGPRRARRGRRAGRAAARPGAAGRRRRGVVDVGGRARRRQLGGSRRCASPQMWNLNRAVRRQLALGALVRPVTGILDDGFPVGHEDLAFDTVYTRGSSPRGHGLMVAGAIGATFDNGVGIDGVNRSRAWWRGRSARRHRRRPVPDSISVGQATVYELATLVRAQPTLRVVNSSVGYNWSLDLVDAARDTAAQRIATQHGALLVTVLKSIGAERGGLLPLVVTSAGNDSDGSFGDQPAKWSSPAANAALVHGARNIIVVGAAKQQAGAPGGAERAAYSNTGAHLLAPGSDVLVTVPGGYRAVSGTSFATPYVAGLVSYLYTLAPTLPQPTLTENPMRDLLVGSSTLVRGADGYLANAFDAALLSDGATRSQRVLRLLTDVDDGSLDGNERVRADGTPVLADGRRGRRPGDRHARLPPLARLAAADRGRGRGAARRGRAPPEEGRERQRPLRRRRRRRERLPARRLQRRRPPVAHDDARGPRRHGRRGGDRPAGAAAAVGGRRRACRLAPRPRQLGGPARRRVGVPRLPRRGSVQSRVWPTSADLVPGDRAAAHPAAPHARLHRPGGRRRPHGRGRRQGCRGEGHRLGGEGVRHAAARRRRALAARLRRAHGHAGVGAARAGRHAASSRRRSPGRPTRGWRGRRPAAASPRAGCTRRLTRPARTP
jgi:hypothetical protein